MAIYFPRYYIQHNTAINLKNDNTDVMKIMMMMMLMIARRKLIYFS